MVFYHKVAAIILVAFTLAGCANTANTAKVTSTNPSSAIVIGKNAITQNRALVGTTMAYYKQMEKLSSQGYADELQLMANSQDIYILPAGVHVQVLSIESGVAHIKMLDAPWALHDGYTETSMIQPASK